MALARTDTLLSLDQWAEILGINPFEFNGCSEGLPLIQLNGCESVWYQHSWQKDFLSREEVAHAIHNAESQIARLLGYYPAPKAITNESVPYPQGKRGLFNQPSRFTGRFNNVPVKLEWSKIIATGVYSETVLDASAAITYSDSDGDGIDDTFTVSVATTETNPANILVYVPSGERFGDVTNSTRWQIRPVTVSISAGTATIAGHKAQCVIPAKLEAYQQTNLDVTDAANFLTDLEIVNRTISTTTPISAYWNISGYNSSSLSAALNDSVMAGGYEHQNGYIRPNMANCSTAYGNGAPSDVTVNYIAGIPLKNGRVDFHMAQIITYLSVALLSSEKCGCEQSNRIIRNWRMHPSDGTESSRPLTPFEIDANPFGNPRRGALYAWREIMQIIETGANV